MMKVMVMLMSFVATVAFADDDEFLVKPEAASEPAKETAKPPKQSAKTVQPKEKLRKCYKCFGKGKQTVNVREACTRCEGTGNIEVEVELKDTVNGRWWYESNYRTTRKVQTKKPCPQCNHRGMLPVKKEVDCAKCNGSGYLTKDGRPAKPQVAEAPAEELEDELVQDEKPEEKSMSLADRIRSRSQTQVNGSEITVATDRGWAEFNFKANDGKFTIKGYDTQFVTTWAGYRANAVRAYKDNVEMVGYRAGQRQLPATKDELESFDWSYRSVIAHVGEAIAFMNKDGRFLAVQVLKVSNRDKGDDADMLHIEFRIY